MSALVISAFPACGKSTFYELYGDKATILDSDSSNYSWIWEDGINTGERNPEFPDNYIAHIQAERDNADIIFVSSHVSVRKALQAAGIPYILIYPHISLKDEWIERCINRGNAIDFVKNLDKNWQEWVETCAEDEYAAKFVLRDRTETQHDISTINWNVVHYLLEAFRRHEAISESSYADMPELKVCLNILPQRYRAYNKESDGQLRSIWLGTSEQYHVLTFYPKEFSDEPFELKLLRAELELSNQFITEIGLLPVIKAWKLD